MLIYKIFRRPEWEALRDTGRTKGAPVDLADGFIHFSTAEQIPGTAGKHFAGAEGLMLAAVEADGLGTALIWEPSRGGALFPHLYRDLRIADLEWIRPLPLLDGAHDIPEEVNGHVDPTRPAFDAFKALDRDRPIEMLNLVRLRTHAAYPSDHPLAGKGLDGADAYRRYSAESAPVLKRIGASIAWRGGFEATLIGPASESWDLVFVARYPTAHAFLEMITDPAYRAAVTHRQAAVRTSRLIRCHPAEAGEAFG